MGPKEDRRPILIREHGRLVADGGDERGFETLRQDTGTLIFVRHHDEPGQARRVDPMQCGGI